MAVIPTALGDAKNELFEKLVADTTSTKGKNAFLGARVSGIDVWSMLVGGGGDADILMCGSVREIRTNVDIIGQFREMEIGDKFISEMLNTVPITDLGRIHKFKVRSGGVPTNTLEPTGIMNEPSAALWVVRMAFEAVFILI